MNEAEKVEQCGGLQPLCFIEAGYRGSRVLSRL